MVNHVTVAQNVEFCARYNNPSNTTTSIIEPRVGRPGRFGEVGGLARALRFLKKSGLDLKKILVA